MDEGGFENIEVEYPAFCYKSTYAQFIANIDNFRNAVVSKLGYKRLSDTFHPDEYRQAIFIDGIEISPILYNSGATFSIKFNCKPQRFLTEGETPQTFSSSGSIMNPTLFEAAPLIKVTGNGIVAIGPYRFTVSGNPETIWIDSENMEVYRPGGEVDILEDENDVEIVDSMNISIDVANGLNDIQQMNSYVSFTDSLMPMIPPGVVNIGMTNTITELEIIPRWYRI